MIDSILAFPNKMRKGNTVYTRDLYLGLEKLGVRTRDYNRYLYQSPSSSCFHFHWPDRVTGGLGRYSPALRSRAIKTFQRTVMSYRHAKKPIFWTVHNEEPHDFRAPEFARTYDTLMQNIFGSIDGFVFLNKFSLNRFLEANNSVRPDACVVIPQMLPNMGSVVAEPPPEIARLAPVGDVFLIPGQIRAHKSIPRAIAIYQSIYQRGDTLLIAGPPSDRGCLNEIRALSAADPSIIIIARALSDGEMLYLYDIAKAVFALSAGTKNSAVLFTALSRCRRVIVSNGPVSNEMSQLFNNDMLVSADIDPEDLRHMLQAPSITNSPAELSVESISRSYLSFFSKIQAEISVKT